MASWVLEAQERQESSKGLNKRMRQEGRIPAVVYGHGLDPISFSVEATDLRDALSTEQGQNVLIDLRIPGHDLDADLAAFIRAIQRDPMRLQPIHVDFQWVSLRETIEVSVPLVLTGEPVGAQEGGSTDQLMYEISVACRADQIPENFTLDISHLDITDTMSISDLEVPEGIEVLHEPDESVVVIATPISEEDLEVQLEGLEGEELEEVEELPEELLEGEELPEGEEAAEGEAGAAEGEEAPEEE
jgi:large subunit ribosomal protein L25